jgi:hypothetical protein
VASSLCAGFLLQSAAHNLSVRMARQDFSHVLSRYPLFATYREMAIANGVDPDDPALRNCRDDGQWRKGMQDDKQLNPERHMPPMAQGTVKMLRDRGHTVAVRCNRNGSLRYTLDAERERTAFELSNRLRKLHGVG